MSLGAFIFKPLLASFFVASRGAEGCAPDSAQLFSFGK